MAKTTYDNITINCFPDGFKMVLPDGYRIDTEYDENYDQIAHLRGGFKYNEYGEEDFTFTCSFIQFNINITEMKKDYKVVPGALLDEVAKGVMENLESQFGEGAKLNLYNSFPASTVIKFYKPLSLFGITMASYIVFYLVEVSESVMFGFQTVYQDDESGNTEFYKHLLNVIKAVRVDGKSVDIGKLTPSKLEKALNMEADGSVEALDLGLSVGISIQNGDEETTYTLNSDGSIATSEGESLPSYDSNDDNESSFDLFSSQIEYGVKVSDSDSRTIIVDNSWSFTLPDGVVFKTDAPHKDILGNDSTAQYLVEGLPYNGRSLFDFELHERFDFGIGPDLDVISCRYDNTVSSGNAQQRIIRDDDNLYVDIVGKPVFFSRSTVQIRIRGENIRPWDFVAGVDGNDEDTNSNWEEIKDLYNKLAESIIPIDGTTKKTKKSNSSGASTDNPDFIITDGVLRKYIGKKNDIVIPDGVKEIADSTFSALSNLKSVVVPEGVKRIGRRSFENCFNLERCFLPESLEEIGEYAFVDCHELKEVYLSDKIKAIGGSAFSECFKLKDVRLPKRIKEIDAFTFKNCHEFTHIVIPEGVRSIGHSAFVACKNLAYLYIPNSTKEFQINLNSHPFENSSQLTIYTPEGSAAQKFAMENNIPFENANKGTVMADNNEAKTGEHAKVIHQPEEGSSAKTLFDTVESSDMNDDVERQKNELNRQVEELRAQADLYSTQNLSAEDRETLAQAQEGIDRLGEQINEISEKQDTLAQHIKRQEEEKKNREEEKKIKKAEMLEKLTEDDVTIDMFVVLSNESRLGKLRRKQDEFFKLYEEDFPTLNKKEMIAKRKEVLEKMKDEEICATYTEKFKQRSLKERFDVSTSNYFNLSNKVEEAMDATAEWYERNEYPELRRMLKEHIGNQTKRLDDQLIPVEKNWTKFSTAKSNLEIVITDDSDIVYNFDQFQLKLGGAMVEVNLNSGGVYQLIINAMNCFTWYWDVDVLSIWEAALKNNVRNNATSYFDDDRLAKDAIQEIRKKYPLRNKDFQDKAHRFIRMVLDEYEGETLDDNPTKAIKEMMDKCFEDESAFSESRRYIAQDKDLSKIPALNEIIDCGIPASMAYKEIPEALGAEITAINKDKLVKKKEQDIEEIRESLSDGSMTGLLKSIELLNGLKKHDDSDDIMIDNQHIDDLIKTCSDRVEDAKEKQYQEALALIDDSTVSSLKEAVELMEGLEDYKDSAKKAEETRNIMGDEILYSEAIADIDEGSAESLLSAIRLLEAVKTYKDSADLLDDIRNKLDNVIIHFNEKAKNMLISGVRNDIDDAAAIYAYIKTIDFDKTRKSLYEERLRTIEKLRNLYDELLGLRDEHANLGGFFKKRQRLENEEKTRKTEERIKMLLAAIE